jgi:hypothetical protein
MPEASLGSTVVGGIDKFGGRAKIPYKDEEYFL